MALVFDPHEKINGNFFTDEAGVVFSGKKYRVLVPKNGPFFTNSLVVKYAGKVLRPGNDYVPTHLYRRSVLNTGRSTHGLIWITNPNIDADDVTITYHAAGIGLATQAQLEAERLKNEDVYPHLCTWDDVIGDVYFPPVDIQFDWENWKGEQSLMNAIAEIANKIAQKPAPGEPVPIDKTMVMVERYYQIVERLFRNAPAHAHILRKDNPHGDHPAARIGAVTLDGVVNDTNKAFGKTKAELTSYINNLAPTAASFSGKMLRHTDTPRQIAGTFKMFGGLSSVSGSKGNDNNVAESALMVNSKAVRFIGKDSTIIDAGTNPVRFKTKSGELVLWPDSRALTWNNKPLLDPVTILPHLPGTSGSTDGVFYGNSSPTVQLTGNGISNAPFTCTWIAPNSDDLNSATLRKVTDEFGDSDKLLATPALIQKLEESFHPVVEETPSTIYDPFGINTYLQDKPGWELKVAKGNFTFEANGKVNINSFGVFMPELKGMTSFDNDLVFSFDKSLAPAGTVSLSTVTTWYDPASPADFVMLTYGISGGSGALNYNGSLYTSIGGSTNTYVFKNSSLGLSVNNIESSFKHKWNGGVLTLDMIVNGIASQVLLDKNNLAGAVGDLFTQHGLARFLAANPVIKYMCANVGSVKVNKLTGTTAPTGPAVEPVRNVDPISRLNNLIDEDSISFQTQYNAGALVWDGNFDYHTYPTLETPFKVVQSDCGPGVLDHTFVCTGGAKAGGDKTYYSGVRGMWFGNPNNAIDYMRYMISVAGGKIQYALVLMKDSHQTDMVLHTDTYTELPKTASSMTVRTYCSHTADGVEYKVYVEGKLVSNYKLEFKNLPQTVLDFLGSSGAASWFGAKLTRSMVLNVASQSKIRIHAWPGLRMDMFPEKYEPISLSPRLLTGGTWSTTMGRGYWKKTRYCFDGGPFAPNSFTFDLAVKTDFQIKFNYWANIVADSTNRKTFDMAFRWLLDDKDPGSYLDLTVFYQANVAKTQLIHRTGKGVVTNVTLEQHSNAYPAGNYKGSLEFRVAQGYLSTYCTVHPTVFSAVNIDTKNPLAAVADFLRPLGLLERIKQQPDIFKVAIYDPNLTIEVDKLNDSNVTPVYGPITFPVDPRIDPISAMPQEYPTNHPGFVKSFGLVWQGKGQYKAMYAGSMDIRLSKVSSANTEVRMYGTTTSWAEELPIFGYIYFNNPDNEKERIGFSWVCSGGTFGLYAAYTPGVNPVTQLLRSTSYTQAISDGTKPVNYDFTFRITQTGRAYRLVLSNKGSVEVDMTIDLSTLTGDMKTFVDKYGAAGWIKDKPDNFVFANTWGQTTYYDFTKICGVVPANYPALKDPFTNNQYLISGKSRWLACMTDNVEWRSSRFHQNYSSQTDFRLDLKRDFSADMTLACPLMVLNDGTDNFKTTFQSAFRWYRPTPGEYRSWIEYGLVMAGSLPVGLRTYVAWKNEEGMADWCLLDEMDLGEKDSLYSFLLRITPSWSPTYVGAHTTAFGKGFRTDAIPAEVTTFLNQYSWAKDVLKTPPDEYELNIGVRRMTIVVDSITGADMGFPDYSLDPEGTDPVPEGGGGGTPVAVEYLPRTKTFINGLSLASPVTLDKSTFNLGNVYDISDTDLPVSTAQSDYVKDKAVVGHSHSTEEFGIRESTDGNMGTVQFAMLVDDETKALDSSLVPPQADAIKTLESLGSGAATKPMLNIVRFGKTGAEAISNGVTSNGWMVTVAANKYFVGKEYAVPLKTFNLAELFPTDHAETTFGIYVDLENNVAGYKILQNVAYPENETLTRIGTLETSDVGIGAATVYNRTRLGDFEQLVTHASDVSAHVMRELTMDDYGYRHAQGLPAWGVGSMVWRFDGDWRQYSNNGPTVLDRLESWSGGIRMLGGSLTDDQYRFALNNTKLRDYNTITFRPTPFSGATTTVVEMVLACYVDEKGKRQRFSVIFNRGNAVTGTDGRLCYAALAVNYGSPTQVLIGLSSTAFTTPDSWGVLKPAFTCKLERRGSTGYGFKTILIVDIVYGTTTVRLEVVLQKGQASMTETRADTGYNVSSDITSRLTQMGVRWDSIVFETDGTNQYYGCPIQFGIGARSPTVVNFVIEYPADASRPTEYLTGYGFIEDVSEMMRHRFVSVPLVEGQTAVDQRTAIADKDFARRVDNPEKRASYLNKSRLNVFTEGSVCKALVVRD
ncbi:MAG: hypothetical protein ACRDBQ_18005 [Shewanella sp.]